VDFQTFAAEYRGKTGEDFTRVERHADQQEFPEDLSDKAMAATKKAASYTRDTHRDAARARNAAMEHAGHAFTNGAGDSIETASYHRFAAGHHHIAAGVHSQHDEPESRRLHEEAAEAHLKAAKSYEASR
jgi:hypothetical protein